LACISWILSGLRGELEVQVVERPWRELGWWSVLNSVESVSGSFGGSVRSLVVLMTNRNRQTEVTQSTENWADEPLFLFTLTILKTSSKPPTSLEKFTHTISQNPPATTTPKEILSPIPLLSSLSHSHVHRNILPWTSSFSHSYVWIMQQRIPRISPKRASFSSLSPALDFLVSPAELQAIFLRFSPAVINSSASRNSWEKAMLMNETDLSLTSRYTHSFSKQFKLQSMLVVFLLCIAFIDILLSDLSTRNVNYKVSKRETMQKKEL
jgi:hypothetical protein